MADCESLTERFKMQFLKFLVAAFAITGLEEKAGTEDRGREGFLWTEIHLRKAKNDLARTRIH